MDFTNNNEENEYTNNSPVQMLSHFANFSSEFISPDRQQRSMLQGQTTQRKLFQQNGNTSVMLDTSGATTFAQQSAFEVFRSKLNENLKNLQVPSKQPTHMRRATIDHSMKSDSQMFSPNSFMNRKNSVLDEIISQGSKMQQLSHKK